MAISTSHKIVSPQEMTAQSALSRIKAILDKAFPSYLVVVGDHVIPFGATLDRVGVWPQVLANVLSTNPALRHAIVLACLDADRQAIEYAKIKEQTVDSNEPL